MVEVTLMVRGEMFVSLLGVGWTLRAGWTLTVGWILWVDGTLRVEL